MKYDFEILCYDGNFYPNETSSLVESEICVDPTPCPLPDMRSKWNTEVRDNGEYLTIDADLTKESVDHASTITVRCAQDVEKFVSDVDPDGNGFLTYTCQTGQIVDSKGSTSWDFPGVFQCKPVCTDSSITIPADSNFTNPSSIRVFDGDKLSLGCRDPSHLMNNDWSDVFEIKCEGGDGTFASVSSWPKCVPPPNCGVPPIPNNASGLITENVDQPILVPNKAVFRCQETLNITENNQTEVISFVTEIGSTIEIPCENTTLDGDDLYNFTLPGNLLFFKEMPSFFISINI